MMVSIKRTDPNICEASPDNDSYETDEQNAQDYAHWDGPYQQLRSALICRSRVREGGEHSGGEDKVQEH